MARVTRAAAHLTIEEVRDRLKTDPRSWCRQRWLIIYTALVEPRKAEEIAKHCGVSKAPVHQGICTDNRFGVKAIETPGKGGRRHEYLTLQEEQQFLAPFFARAESGEIATTAEIWQAFEAQVGHKVDDSTLYRLLKRHGWRKLMPRPRHPKAHKEAQHQFKKTLRRRLKRQLPLVQQKTSGQFSSWRKMRDALAAFRVPSGVGLHPVFVLVPLHRLYASRGMFLPQWLLRLASLPLWFYLQPTLS
jgi:transposase